MRLHPAFAAAALLLLHAPVTGAATRTITPISALHQVSANGIPLLASPPQLVTVQGTVTSPDGVYSPTSTDIYVQDATGGVDVFASGVLFGVALGDSVEVTGYVKNFNGLCEI
ncbi:MAG TPA: hypothetical protein VI792_02645, partial [Candidatus Eisenbacteria bacterium]